uniref:Zinc finger DHHC-type containing 16b n=1 Tax=Cyprinus carpio TaxID=7962 RepID=A0A8C1UF02_CYPCA
MRSWRWFLSRVMRLFLRWFRLCPRRGRRKRPSRLRDLWHYWRVLLKSLYYNVLTNSDTALDCVFEPIYWLVDNMTRWFGVVFVSLVIVLTSSVVIIVYLCVLPIIFSTYPVHWILWHLCYGHWNLLMLVYHYYKATTTYPGFPPQVFLTFRRYFQKYLIYLFIYSGISFVCVCVCVCVIYLFYCNFYLFMVYVFNYLFSFILYIYSKIFYLFWNIFCVCVIYLFYLNFYLFRN